MTGERARAADPAAGPGPRDVLAGLRALRRIPPALRAAHERVETLEQKFLRWQRVRVPEVPLAQRPYDPSWAEWFERERERIVRALEPPPAAVVHHGSSAVPGLGSKNVIDLGVALAPPADLAAAESRLAALGYEPWGNSPLDPETVWLWRLEPDRAFAVHVAAADRPWLSEVLDHRDFLRAHPEERERYAELKRRLAEEEHRGFLEYTIRKMELWLELAARVRAWRERAAGDTEREERP